MFGLKGPVHVEQWAQVQCHIVDGTRIKGNGGGCRAVSNGDGVVAQLGFVVVWARRIGGHTS